MGKRTGKPKGRPRGSKNKHTREREAAIASAAAQTAETLGARTFDGDAHAMLMLVYKDLEQPLQLRLDAAKAAIGFEKPKLAAVDNKLSGSVGQYVAQPIPTEKRHSDSLARPNGAAVNGHSTRSS